MLKSIFIGGSFILAGSLFAAAPAMAAECVPQDAWSETVIDQAHVPAVPEVTGTVEHEAVTHVETAYQRYSWNPKGGDRDRTPGESTPLNDPDHWQANTSNYKGDDPIGEAFQRGNGNGGNNASWFFWTAIETEVVDEPAWTETVVISPAIPEIPEISHIVEHEAVTCSVEPESTPEVVAPPIETPYSAPVATETSAEAEQQTQPERLAETGFNANASIAAVVIIGIGLILYFGFRRFD